MVDFFSQVAEIANGVHTLSCGRPLGNQVVENPEQFFFPLLKTPGVSTVLGPGLVSASQCILLKFTGSISSDHMPTYRPAVCIFLWVIFFFFSPNPF